MKWFRFYTEVVDDPKVQKLSPKLFRLWVNCMCVAGMNDGILPDVDSLAFRIRWDRVELQKCLDELHDFGLLDVSESKTYAPHNWNARQYKSDNVTLRVKHHRDKTKRYMERSNSDNVTVDETPSEADTDTDTEEKHLSISAKSPDRFEDFWIKSWLKVGKGAARAKWKQKVRGEAMAARVIAEAIRQGPGLLAAAKRDGRTPLHPATWLSQERYDDADSSTAQPQLYGEDFNPHPNMIL